MFRMGDWKVVQVNASDNWELYNLREDPTEMVDLSAKYPERVKEMVAKFKAIPFMKTKTTKNTKNED